MRRLNLLFIAAAAGCAPSVTTELPSPVPARQTDWLVAFSVDAAEIARAEQTPAMEPIPPVSWGPLPPGTAHVERVPTFDLRHQATAIRVDWNRHAVVGRTTITLAAPARPLQTVELDAVGMKIDGVTDANGRTLRHAYDGNRLSISLSAALQPDQATTISVAYETVRPKKGFYFIDRAHRFWTQGEDEDTRYWVPTYDYPNDKTTWEFWVTVPRGEKALSNGRLVSTRESGEGTVWHWLQDRPASTYLMTAAGGSYEIVRDSLGSLPVNYWSYPDSTEATRRAFGKTPRMIAIFEEKTGVKYPWAKYDQIVVPDFIFGGMENVTATTQDDQGIFHPREGTTDGLVSHELAHQWFGDYVTIRDWSHAWLNEGFATFMETIYYEGEGETDRAALGRRSNIGQAIRADSRARRPLVYNRWQNGPFELFFSGHIYPKGAAVLNIIRHQLGDSLFWRGMKDYLAQHAFGSVVSDDVKDSFERVSSRDFDPLFNKWVYGAGYPVYRVSQSYDAATRRVTVEAQEIQPRDSLTGFFDPDVDIEVLTDNGPVQGKLPVRSGRGTLTLELPSQPRSIRWDKGDWLPDAAHFPRSTAMLAYQLAHDDDVTGRMEALDELARRKNERYAAAALARALHSDAYWSVRAEAAQALAAFTGNEAVARVLRAASGDADSRVRQEAATALTRFPGSPASQ